MDPRLHLPAEKVSALETMLDDSSTMAFAINLKTFNRFKAALVSFALGKETDMTAYVSATTHPYVPVNVVEQGQVILEIPSILMRLPTVRKNDVEDLNTAANRTHLLSESNPPLAVKQMELAILKNASKIPEDIERKAKWTRLLEYCGHSFEDTDTKAVKKVAIVNEDLVEIDEDDVEEL